MVKDSDDPHRIAVQVVKDTMPPVMKTANGRLNVEPLRAGLRVPPEQVEGLLKGPDIVRADRLAECFYAIVQDGRKIGVRRGAQANFSHAARR